MRTKISAPQPSGNPNALATAALRVSGTVRVPRSVNPSPEAYALTCSGRCCEPVYMDGDTLVCDPQKTPAIGDFVAIWWRDGIAQPQVKRLVFALPPREWWADTGEAQFMLIVDQLSPPRQYWLPLRKVDAVHKVIYRVPRPRRPPSRSRRSAEKAMPVMPG